MHSSQLHLASLEKSQLEYYYQNLVQQGAGGGGGQQQAPDPSNNGALAQELQGYPPMAPQQQSNNHANKRPSVPMAHNHHQHDQAPGNNIPRIPSQFNFQMPDPFFSSREPVRRRPWWMWTIGVLDIIAALLFTVKVVHNVVTKDRYIQDRDTLMWTFFLIFLSLCVQFLMGVGLLIGLKSDQDGTTFWYCQSWICGAYFLFGETGFLLFGAVVKLHNGGADVIIKLLIVAVKVVFRVVSFILVRRFMRDLRGKSQYRLSATELEQYQQQRLAQIQQLQQYQQEQQQRQHEQHQQQQQQYFQEVCQQQAQGGEGGGGTLGRRGTRGSECYYYVPEMSVMMNMMINNAASAAIPTI